MKTSTNYLIKSKNLNYLKKMFSRLSNINHDEMKNRNNSTTKPNKTLLTKEDSNWYEYGCV